MEKRPWQKVFTIKRIPTMDGWHVYEEGKENIGGWGPYKTVAIAKSATRRRTRTGIIVVEE